MSANAKKRGLTRVYVYAKRSSAKNVQIVELVVVLVAQFEESVDHTSVSTGLGRSWAIRAFQNRERRKMRQLFKNTHL